MTINSDTVEQRRIAVLIDCDNAQASLLGPVLTETAKYGLTTIRRAYGDWTTPNMASWRDTLQNYAIQPIQQFRYTTGKSATDSAMIIDAMDLLYAGAIEGFCLVSSDSDYTRLATRIQEKGFFVMGIGRTTTPKSFVNGCNLFVYTENLIPRPEGMPAPAPDRKTASLPDPLALLMNAYEIAATDSDWVFLGHLGVCLRQLDPSFDPRTYGHKQLSVLIRAYPTTFEVKEEKGKTRNDARHFVRLKTRA